MTKFEEDLNRRMDLKEVPMYFTQSGCSMTRKTYIETNWVFDTYKNWHSDEEFQKMVEIGGSFSLASQNLIDENKKLVKEISDLKSQLQQQALPVVPECVAEWIEILKNKGLKPLKNPETYGETGFTEEKLQNIVFWISEHQEDYMRAWLDGYTVEKPQLFYIALPKVYGLSDSTVIKVCDWVANLKENKKMTVKEKFLNDIKSLIENKEIPKEDKVLTVWIETPEMTARELIVNPFENLQAKHDYYDKAYDDNLNLKANPDIFISTYSTDGQIFSLVEVVE